VLRFLSVRSSYWGTEFHYNAPLMPIVFLAAVEGLARISARAGHLWGRRPAGRPAVRRERARTVTQAGAAVMALIAVALTFVLPFARLWDPRTYVTSPAVQAEWAAIARVPTGVTVEATETMLAPLAARDVTSWAGNRGIRRPEYVVVAARGGLSFQPAHALAFVERRHPGTEYTQIFARRHVFVFRLGTARLAPAPWFPGSSVARWPSGRLLSRVAPRGQRLAPARKGVVMAAASDSMRDISSEGNHSRTWNATTAPNTWSGCTAEPQPARGPRAPGIAGPGGAGLATGG
jgi:Predicted membrane protein (DUF2079)